MFAALVNDNYPKPQTNTNNTSHKQTNTIIKQAHKQTQANPMFATRVKDSHPNKQSKTSTRKHNKLANKQHHA